MLTIELENVIKWFEL